MFLFYEADHAAPAERPHRGAYPSGRPVHADRADALRHGERLRPRVEVASSQRTTWHRGRPRASRRRSGASPARGGVARCLLSVAGAAEAASPGPGAWSDEEEEAVFDVPAPPTLPGAHAARSDLHLRVHGGRDRAGRGEPARAASSPSRWYSHGEMEVPLVPRQVVRRARCTTAPRRASRGSSGRSCSGAPSCTGRGVWSSVRGLASGGGFGLVLPVPRDVSRDQAEVLRTARVVRPWDETRFRRVHAHVPPLVRHAAHHRAVHLPAQAGPRLVAGRARPAVRGAPHRHHVRTRRSTSATGSRGPSGWGWSCGRSTS